MTRAEWLLVGLVAVLLAIVTHFAVEATGRTMFADLAVACATSTPTPTATPLPAFVGWEPLRTVPL